VALDTVGESSAVMRMPMGAVRKLCSAISGGIGRIGFGSDVLKDENVNENLSPRMRNLVAMLCSEWKELELQIVEMNDEVERIASSDDACRRLRQSSGIGTLVATAVVASIGNGAAFRRGGSSRPDWGCCRTSIRPVTR
jgi:transposase